MTDLRGRQWLAPARDPQWVERRILEVLADLRPFQSLDSRTLSQKVWSSDRHGRSHTAAAVGRLKVRRLVEERSSGRYAITDAGVAALGLAEAMDEPEGAA
jgi:hypothetical protein